MSKLSFSLVETTVCATTRSRDVRGSFQVGVRHLWNCQTLKSSSTLLMFPLIWTSFYFSHVSWAISICVVSTGSEKSQGMRALAISANRRYLAVSECGEKASITVFDLQHEQGRKRKVLTAGDTPVKEFVCMAFSPDSKYLIGQSGAPEWMVVFWLWEKHKILATVKTSNSNNPVNQVCRPCWINAAFLHAGMHALRMLYYSVDVPSGQLQPFQQHAALCEWNWCVQAVPLLRGGLETEQLLKGWVHQLPVSYLDDGRACDRWDRHRQAAGVWVWRPAKRDLHGT